jgi:uroporphyrinogen decarboxylase
MLRDLDWPVDIEPPHPKMAHLVIAAAEQTAELKKRKSAAAVTVVSPTSDVVDTRAPWYDSPFMKACRREPTEVTPIWLMRQAGRYMSEYRSVRHGINFLDLCKRPDLCCEVMITAVNKLGVDAAILFADLLPILEPMGMHLEFVAGDGPVIHNPIREPRDVDRLKELESVAPLQFTLDAVKLTRRELAPNLPLIGFAGAPFTLASYCIEGGGSRNYLHTKSLMYRDGAAWKELMSRLTNSVVRYLAAQLAAGCQCVQIFDSWVGCLSPDDYRTYVMPYMKRLIADLPKGAPVIHFAAGNPAILPLVAESGASVIGLDWRGRLDDGWNAVGHRKAVQGNLDPAVLLADQETIRIQAKAVLDQANRRPGHIFTLGHGIHQQTPVENAVALVKMVHEMSQK